MKLNFSRGLALACVLGLWAVSAHAAYDVIVTPDQFNPQTWGGNLLQATVGAYPGDNANGYYYTNNFGNSPSATIIIPLPAGLPAGAHVYNVYEWNPTAHSAQWHVVDIAADGTMNNNNDHSQATGIPWLGQFGTNHQYLQNPQDNPSNLGGWLKLGPGPQSDPTLDGGSGVWINPSTGLGAPYLQIHYLGFENAPESFDAFRVVQIDAVPEPASGFLLLLGAVLVGVRRSRRSA
jgi:PEP-CTERM motif-containing protein